MFYLLGWNHPLRSGLGDFMSSRDLLIDRNLEYLGHLVTRSTGHTTVIRLQLKEMILITNSVGINISLSVAKQQSLSVIDEG